MKPWQLYLCLSILLVIAACSKSPRCDQNVATNKMLAIGKIQARMFATGGEGIEKFAASLTKESAQISELIAQAKYQEACNLADDIATKYKFDLAKEQSNMLTIEQLAVDGGKGTGTCSVADAAKRQMEIHSLLQAEVSAGRKQSAVFGQFQEDSRGFAELLTTNPSDGCALMESLREKYELPSAAVEEVSGS